MPAAYRFTYQPNDSVGVNGCFSEIVDRHCGRNFETAWFLSYFCVNSILGSWLVTFVVGHFEAVEKG